MARKPGKKTKPPRKKYKDRESIRTIYLFSKGFKRVTRGGNTVWVDRRLPKGNLTEKQALNAAERFMHVKLKYPNLPLKLDPRLKKDVRRILRQLGLGLKVT